MVQRETEYYRENIGNVKSIDEFLDDDRLFRYAMKAHGLDDMAYGQGPSCGKVLEEGIDDPNSFANKLTDKRYKEFAQRLQFRPARRDATVYNAAQQGTVQNYLLEAVTQRRGDRQSGGDGKHPVLREEHQVGAVGRPISCATTRSSSTPCAPLASMVICLPSRVVRTMLEGGIDDPESPRQPEHRRALRETG